MIRGLVLAGGKSSRFGSNKAVASYQGVRLIERAVSLLNELDLKPIVAVRKDMDYPFLKCVAIHDKLPDQGPLGGIYTAMTMFKKTPFLVLTCDMPRLTPSALAELLARHETHSLITAYSTRDETPQPFPAVYEPVLLGAVREKLKCGNLSMHDLFDRTPTKKLIPWKGESNIFININSTQALKILETLSSD
ncbi:MAG: molybdenum cofactor guanylyltransferase [Candidatus Omnitrophica bacterium]|nr:molybdenum cofactor guanylyltransferase [Candidatus Omnitrophota bacterium]